VLLEEKLKELTKRFLASVQQKFDLTNATIPPFASFAKWFGVGAAALVLSAAANALVVKYVFFPSIKIAAPKPSGENASVPALITAFERPKADDFKEIVRRNIFNSEQIEVVTKETGVVTQCNPVKSDLSLKFTGVIFGGTKETSLVLLELTSSKQADTFIFNENVNYPQASIDAKINDITRDKVYLLRNGAACSEYLELQQPEVVKKRVPGVARSQSGGANLASKSTDPEEYCESGFCRRKGGDIQADRRWVDRALSTDFAKTLQDAKASPNLVNGEVKGFVLTRIRPDSVYEKMGFQDGDVVETINGIDLNDAARAIQTLNSLRQENSIELSVKRNGVNMPLKIQVK
jgi:type II secretion system protein C